MVACENRRAATLLVVSTGSAAGRRSQPGMGQSGNDRESGAFLLQGTPRTPFLVV